MNIYHISSLVKLVIGVMIIISSLRFIDPRVDPTTSVIIMGLGVILMVRGLGFYVYLILMSLFSNKKYSYLASYAYKISLVTGLFASVNWLLIGFRVWGRWIGIGLLIVCAVVIAMILGVITPPETAQELESEAL